MLLLTGAAGRVACWNQRAAPADGPVLWDYHVVLAVRGEAACGIWDLDTRLGFPLPAQRWLEATFPTPDLIPPGLRPRFLAVPADSYRRDFSSDRRHMFAADGSWLQPPPPWPEIRGGAIPLMEYLRQARQGWEALELSSFLGLPA